MRDSYNREINYLRISVTDRCNLKCQYCMPESGIECVSEEAFLSFDEIVRIVQQAVKLGITRVKITGGEPLLRQDVAKLVGMLHGVSGVEQVTMTTNGILLDRYIDELISNGLNAVNISIDSINPDRYRQVTRKGNLEDALRGLRAAIESGIKVKVNSVLYPGEDWMQMVELAKDSPVYVRFIETMPIGMGDEYSGVFVENVKEYFDGLGISLYKDSNIHGNGPAVYYKPEGYEGYIGIIAPIHGKFCDSCNRIRLSATGMLKPCLCFNESFDIKKCLRDGNDEDILELLKSAIMAKPDAHRFTQDDYIKQTQCMAQIGG